MPAALVGTGPDGLPTGPGVVRGRHGWVVQLGKAFAAAPGTRVTLRLPDGRTVQGSAASPSAPGTRAAASSSDAPLVLILPASDGRWTVVAVR